MTSSNLAICISQSLLWASQTVDTTSASPDAIKAQSDSMEKPPKLVQYLIENCARLFGEECLHLFSDVSMLSDLSLTNEEETLKDSESDSDEFQNLVQFRVNTNGESLESMLIICNKYQYFNTIARISRSFKCITS